MKRSAINNYAGQLCWAAPGKLRYMATLLGQTITKLISPMDKESVNSPALTKHYAKQDNRSQNYWIQTSASQTISTFLGLAVGGGREKAAGNDSKFE